MNKKAFIPISALMGALLLALFAAMTPFVADLDRAYAQTATINFAENGDGAVATFTAEDPEGAMPITWSIAASGADPDGADGPLETADAADADHFDIDSKTGVLTFDVGGDTDPDLSVAPDFENPKGSALTGTDSAAHATQNTYRVVVAASDMETGGMMGYHKVTVMVTNVNEAGKVSWTVDAADDGTHTADTPKLMQFQVGASLMAMVEDGDVRGGDKTVEVARTDVAADPIWQWYRGSSLINGATADTYNVVAADVGHTIRAQATYRIGSAPGLETASLTSDYPVLAARSGDNELKFDPTAVSRNVAEGKMGMMVGAPVTAMGNHGAVNYTLAGTDNTKFKIDQKTGQITTMVDLDYEAAAGEADNCTTQNECSVTVAANDASGDAAPTVATVTIKITDVDEKPVFVTETTANSPTSITSPENRTELFSSDDTPATTAVNVTYLANDPETRNLTYHLMGPDGAMFNLSSGGVLSFRAKPDYEMPGDANMRQHV